MNEQEAGLYSIGDLLFEYTEGLNLSSGLIVGCRYNKDEQENIYSIKWHDLNIVVEISEAIMKWRIENNIWEHYPVIR
jgi:hypothetical protein